MKKIEYYMNLPYKLVIIPDPDEGGYVACYPDLPGCITAGSSLEDAADAKKEWLRTVLESGTAITEPVTADGYF
ncbi:MAG: type II toxin-antitoxin system HicB family antitoxin [Erysipelotrichaceae bacterium]|nr:type II toxin-antitoxin system HicB family antitoxin [Erysipelotrichaceae bacterium]